jgi:hypothetical protein
VNDKEALINLFEWFIRAILHIEKHLMLLSRLSSGVLSSY